MTECFVLMSPVSGPCLLFNSLIKAIKHEVTHCFIVFIADIEIAARQSGVQFIYPRTQKISQFL